MTAPTDPTNDTPASRYRSEIRAHFSGASRFEGWEPETLLEKAWWLVEQGDEEIDRLREDRDRLHTTLGQTRELCEEANVHAAGMERERDEARAEAESMLVTIDRLTVERDDAEDRIDPKASRLLDDAREQVTTHAREMVRITGELENAKSEVEQLRNALVEVTIKLGMQRDEARRDIDRLGSHSEALLRRAEEAEARVAWMIENEARVISYTSPKGAFCLEWYDDDGGRKIRNGDIEGVDNPVAAIDAARESESGDAPAKILE